jgi:NAD(P)-dependent dehydrogenase (short-subunit alcohol dehydrogenase family)
MLCDFCLITALVGLFVVYKLLDWLLRLPGVGRTGDRYVLITGCDTGFGHDLARRLDSRGCHVFAACLTEKGETELTKGCSDRLATVPLDVTKTESVRKAFDVVKERLEKDGKVLWAVVNNAGISISVGNPELQTTDDYRDVAVVNLYGLIDVTMTFLPLIKKSRGRVVNMASIAGRVSMKRATPYCVAKYGVEAFSDGLRLAYRLTIIALTINYAMHLMI